MAHIHTLGNKTPHIHETAMIAPTAVIIGDVTIDEGVSIWPNVVIRGYCPDSCRSLYKYTG